MFATYGAAEELEMVNRPVNTSGMTGLLFTTAPQTIPYRTMEISAASLSEKSLVPDFTASAYPVSVTYGIHRDHELALRAQYWYIRSSDAAPVRSAGDVEIAWKWNFLQQPERSSKPWISAFGVAILPAADVESGVPGVRHWGARLGLAVGSEWAIEDYVLGMYLDAQYAFQDLSDPSYRDTYQLFNAGMLFPISKHRNLQIIIEYNRMGGNDVQNQYLVNYSAVTYGLRLVSSQFNLTVGTQFIHRAPEGYDNSSGVIGMASFKY